jgi:Reverse transcriptase (RNA-dependent DNA polymerase)
LGENYSANQFEIFKLEKRLTVIIDAEFKHLVQESKVFETLNNEKPTQHFLNIARSSNPVADIGTIKDDNGCQFATESDRHNHITKFYSELYRKDPTVSGTIEDFLGQDIINNPVVQNSKLTQAEKDELELDLSFMELNEALKEANSKSAPGLDGYSTRIIKKFWHIFGSPTFNCTIECFEEKSLTEFFGAAQIRLIPKKGDTDKIKNWRPISLLSNFYKLISRAVNNRLKKVVNRVLSRAQKGFNKSKQIHEVILNSCEIISYCKKII